MIPQALKNNRDFVNRMNALGIDDVEKYINKRIALISNSLHMDVHIDGWNADWNKWIKNNSNFTLNDLNKNINDMMKKYNIPKSSRDTRPYGLWQTPRVKKKKGNYYENLGNKE